VLNRLGIGELHVVLPRSRLVARLQSYLALTKPRIIELLLITTVPTMFVAARHVPSLRLMVMTVAGGALAAGGANAMNMVYDRDIDAQMERTKSRPLVTGAMERTKSRPLVTGAITPRAATIFAVTLEVAAFALLWSAVNPLSAVLALSATAFYMGVYTMWLKRSSPQNIVIGGAAGAVPVLVGWSAVTGRLGLAPLVMFGIIFLWTPPHFWALAVRYRDDYARAKVPMLPSVAGLRTVTHRITAYVVAVWLLSLVLAPVAHLNLAYGAVAFVLGGVFLGYSWALSRDPTPRRAMKLFGFSITYLTALFVVMGADAVIRVH